MCVHLVIFVTFEHDCCEVRWSPIGLGFRPQAVGNKAITWIIIGQIRETLQSH